jgi:hypothetical protein
MNSYRERYLVSEHWFGLKTRAMQHYGCRCAICGKADIANDVHHIKYRHLKDVRLSDLRVLCRQHHEMVHAALDRYPSLFAKYNRCDSAIIWEVALQKIGVKPILALPAVEESIRRWRPWMGMARAILPIPAPRQWGDNWKPSTVIKPKDPRHPFADFAPVIQR